MTVLRTDDPRWQAYEGEQWKRRFEEQHRTLHHAEDVIKTLRDERDRYRNALVWIADNESGVWGVHASAALRGNDAA